MSHGWNAITHLGASTAPTAAVRSATLDAKPDTHMSLKAECSAAATLRLFPVRPDGTISATPLAEYTLVAGTPFAVNEPLALGRFQVELAAAVSGWTGYAVVRTGR